MCRFRGMGEGLWVHKGGTKYSSSPHDMPGIVPGTGMQKPTEQPWSLPSWGWRSSRDRNKCVSSQVVVRQREEHKAGWRNRECGGMCVLFQS